jgi:Glyoxalase-like domain
VAASPQLTGLDLAADPAAWAAAGFDVRDDALALGGVELRLGGDGPGAIRGWDFDVPVPGDRLDGLIVPGMRPPVAQVAAHPNGIAAVDHVVAFSPDLDRTVAALESAGLDLRRRREGPTGGGSARQAFFRVGEAILEVVEHPAQAREAGDPAAPARLWGLALLAPDLDATAAYAGERLGEVRDAIQPGRRIATFTRAAQLGLAVAVLSPRR